MRALNDFTILPQPDETTCGPTCLHAVYDFFGCGLPLEQVVRETSKVEGGGTLAVFLACHALRRGFRAVIYTYNLHVFDPTWFQPEVDLAAKLRAQSKAKHSPKLRRATQGYLEFLALGGRLRFEELTTQLIRGHLKRGIPILTGLSATYLYQSARELPNCEFDDVKGDASGHFVVLCGYNQEQREVLVGDPLYPRAPAVSNFYSLPIRRVINSILLGILTYDSNLLVLEPERARQPREKAE